MRWKNEPDPRDLAMLRILHNDFDKLYDTMPGVQKCYAWCVVKWSNHMADYRADEPEYEDYAVGLKNRMHPTLFDVISINAEYDVETGDIRWDDDDFYRLYYDLPGVRDCYEWCNCHWFIYLYRGSGNNVPKYADYVIDSFRGMHQGLFNVISERAQQEVRANHDSTQREIMKAELSSQVAATVVITIILIMALLGLIWVIV